MWLCFSQSITCLDATGVHHRALRGFPHPAYLKDGDGTAVEIIRSVCPKACCLFDGTLGRVEIELAGAVLGLDRREASLSEAPCHGKRGMDPVG